MKIVAIIQARLGSSRLPGKVLADIAGTPMLTRIVERVRATTTVNEVVVATTTSPDDDALVRFVDEHRLCGIYRGPTDDVLSRFRDCALLHQADIVVRVTADDPLKDPGIIEHATRIVTEDDSIDYCSNTTQPTFPEGLDIEVIRFSALERAHQEAMLASEREHVTPFIWKRPEMFRLKSFSYETDLSAWRWTVDHPKDLAFMRHVFEHFNDPLVDYRTVIAWLKDHPEVRAINQGPQRNEGYQKSLAQESL